MTTASGEGGARRAETYRRDPGVRSPSIVDPPEDDVPIKAPWHFKILLVGTAGYLVYRLIWLIFWLTGHGWHG